MSEIPTVGFIGTGTMGKPMARNLLRNGYRVYVHNRTQSRYSDLLTEGAEAPGSPAAVAASASIVIAMLPGAEEVEEALFGDGGVSEGVRRGSIFIDMSTIQPQRARAIAERLAEHGVDALDAPVSGGEIGAIDATLAIFAGGSRTAYDRAETVLRCMGRPAYMGLAGSGQLTKTCNQLIVAATIEAVAEAFALGSAFGIDLAQLREALLGGFAASRVLDVHGRRMIERNFAPGGAIKLHLKDWETIAWAMRETGLNLPEAAVAFEQVSKAVARGMGDLDQSCMYALLEEQ